MAPTMDQDGKAASWSEALGSLRESADLPGGAYYSPIIDVLLRLTEQGLDNLYYASLSHGRLGIGLKSNSFYGPYAMAAATNSGLVDCELSVIGRDGQCREVAARKSCTVSDAVETMTEYAGALPSLADTEA